MRIVVCLVATRGVRHQRRAGRGDAAAGEDEEARYSIAGSGTQLEVRTLDLDQNPARLLAQVEAIAARIRDLASPRVETPVPAAA
jgi:hypothetical protein